MNYLADIYHGLNSGYPLCCILEFVKTSFSEGHTLYYRQRRNCICAPNPFPFIKEQIDNEDSVYNKCSEFLSKIPSINDKNNILCDKLKDKIFYKILCNCSKNGYVPCNKCHEELKKKNLIKSIPYKDAKMTVSLNTDVSACKCSECEITYTCILFWILLFLNIIGWIYILFIR